MQSPCWLEALLSDCLYANICICVYVGIYVYMYVWIYTAEEFVVVLSCQNGSARCQANSAQAPEQFIGHDGHTQCSPL